MRNAGLDEAYLIQGRRQQGPALTGRLQHGNYKAITPSLHPSDTVESSELLLSEWDPVPGPGVEPGPPALGAQSPGHRTTREVPPDFFLLSEGCPPCLSVIKIVRAHGEVGGGGV